MSARIGAGRNDLQHDLDRRRPGSSRYTTQRQEARPSKDFIGIFEGKTTGTPIGFIDRKYRSKVERL